MVYIQEHILQSSYGSSLPVKEKKNSRNEGHTLSKPSGSVSEGLKMKKKE